MFASPPNSPPPSPTLITLEPARPVPLTLLEAQDEIDLLAFDQVVAKTAKQAIFKVIPAAPKKPTSLSTRVNGNDREPLVELDGDSKGRGLEDKYLKPSLITVRDGSVLVLRPAKRPHKEDQPESGISSSTAVGTLVDVEGTPSEPILVAKERKPVDRTRSRSPAPRTAPASPVVSRPHHPIVHPDRSSRLIPQSTVIPEIPYSLHRLLSEISLSTLGFHRSSQSHSLDHGSRTSSVILRSSLRIALEGYSKRISSGFRFLGCMRSSGEERTSRFSSRSGKPEERTRRRKETSVGRALGFQQGTS